jgi:hypothetical protein
VARPVLTPLQLDRLRQWSFSGAGAGLQAAFRAKKAAKADDAEQESSQKEAAEQDSSKKEAPAGSAAGAEPPAAPALPPEQEPSLAQLRASWAAGIAHASNRALAPCSEAAADRGTDMVDWAAVKRAMPPDSCKRDPPQTKQPPRSKRRRSSRGAGAPQQQQQQQPETGSGGEVQGELPGDCLAAAACKGGGDAATPDSEDACFDALSPLLRQLDPLSLPDQAPRPSVPDEAPQVGISIMKRFTSQICAMASLQMHAGR